MAPHTVVKLIAACVYFAMAIFGVAYGIGCAQDDPDHALQSLSVYGVFSLMFLGVAAYLMLN